MMTYISSLLIWFIFPLLLVDNGRVICYSDQRSRSSSDDGFFEALRMFNMIEKYPQLSKIGTCFSISNISAIKSNQNTFNILLTVEIRESLYEQNKFCRNISKKGINENSYPAKDGSNVTDVLNQNKDNRDSLLAVSQIVGIVICGLLLTIFFFIAGFMRIKNFLRRNKTTLKVSGLRSCLTTEEGTNNWGTSRSGKNLSAPSVSNYLQLQSVMDRSVSQFMIKPTHYSKAIEQENKKGSSLIRRKTSIKNKLIPKKTNNQNCQRRYSLTNEIDSVMSKHFNMIGVTPKPGYRSTQNIGGFLQRPVLSQNSIMNDSLNKSVDQRYRNQTMNCISDAVAFNKNQANRYYRNSNFPCRRATTIGGRSMNSKRITSLRGLNISSPPVDAMYSSQHSVLNTQLRNNVQKPLILDEGKEIYERYLLKNQSVVENNIENNSQTAHLKVPKKPKILPSTNKCIFSIDNEKRSKSQETVGTNSHCSSYEKASSNWSSLDVQDSEALENK